MNLFTELILGPFRLVWDNLPPEYAIPIIVVMAIVLIAGTLEMGWYMMFGTDIDTESNEPEPEREWQFYPEDFEQ